MAEKPTETPTLWEQVTSGPLGSVAALGALALVAVLGLFMCPSDDDGAGATVDEAAERASELAAVDRKPADQSAERVANSDPAGADREEAGAGDPDAVGAEGNGGAEANNGDGADGDGADEDAADEDAANGDAANGDAANGDAANGDAADTAPSDAQVDGGAADGAGEPGVDVIEIEDGATPKSDEADGAGNASASAGSTPAAATDSDRSKEATMTAAELYAAAKLAYDGRNYREAYRLATKSYRAEPSAKTQELRGWAACQIKDRDAAKTIVKSFKLMDPKRKELRAFCKEHGVNTGL